MDTSRRDFIKKSALGGAALTLGGLGLSASAKSFSSIFGSNDKIRVGLVGFSDRARNTLIPAFLSQANELNFKIVAVSDLWKRRRDEAFAYFKEKTGKEIILCRNNDELYERKDIDAVIISTPDFAHALHAIEAVKHGKDVYCEKPFAETMDDANAALQTILSSKSIVQIGSQRRSGTNYIAANDYIRSGKFGNITMVELIWNVNQPGRWRRPQLVKDIKKEDIDWDRFLLNRPKIEWDPRVYLEYRLFWPFSTGIPGQWMSHQIDTVHWFSGYNYPRSVVANGGIYMWHDGRKNVDTLTSVFDYGPKDNMEKGFQVLYTSRFHNDYRGVKELYFSNGGTLDLEKNKITSEGGLKENSAKEMDMQANLLPDYSLPNTNTIASANTGTDALTTMHMRNWMECVRDRKTPNADVFAGYNHSVAVIMTNAALHTGKRVVFDENTKQVMTGNEIFKY